MIGSALRRAVLCLSLVVAGSVSLIHVAARQATPIAPPAAAILNETPGNVPVSMLVRNLGSNDDILLGASSPIAERVELHHSPLVAGVRVMELASEGVALPAGSTTILEPVRDHLMLIGMRESLVQGELFPLTLQFQRAGKVSVTGRVRRKLDAAGVAPIPPFSIGGIEISLVSAPPAPAAR